MLKLGCVSYLNTLPLIDTLDPQEVEKITRPPAELLELLLKGQVNAALLPIVNYFETPNLFLIPNIAIACRGPVQSVKLYLSEEQNPPISPFTKGGCGDLTHLKTIYLDPESRTSHALLKVLLQKKYKLDLNQIQFTSNLSHPNIQAKLLIGDKTFKENGDSVDLGQEWQEWAHKPFVFAAWMTNKPQYSELSPILQKSRDNGLKNIEKIIENISNAPHPPLNLRGGEEKLREYFTKNLYYYMGEEELAGIRHFFKLLKPIEGYTHELDFKFIS